MLTNSPVTPTKLIKKPLKTPSAPPLLNKGDARNESSSPLLRGHYCPRGCSTRRAGGRRSWGCARRCRRRRVRSEDVVLGAVVLGEQAVDVAGVVPAAVGDEERHLGQELLYLCRPSARTAIGRRMWYIPIEGLRLVGAC
eukprot:848084-Pyramimonas_sp.AAC.1